MLVTAVHVIHLSYISLISGDMTGQKNGMCRCTGVQEVHNILDLNKRQGIMGYALAPLVYSERSSPGVKINVCISSY